MRYRRARVKGGTYFFTLVTHKRNTMLCHDENIHLLREAFQYVMARHPFTIDAHVILPEHLHCLWTLPEGDCDFSTRWRLIKSHFTRNVRGHIGNSRISRAQSDLRVGINEKTRKQPIWQKRFWEHVIRDEQDMKNHVEYIHYNPVKHGLVTSPVDWPLSSIHRYVLNGLYTPDWGADKKTESVDDIGRE